MKNAPIFHRTLGIGQIDDEHEELTRILNTLRQASAAKDGGLAEILGEFVRKIKAHHESEEELLRHYDYPGLEKQKRDHALYARIVQRLHDRVLNGASVSLVEIDQMIKEFVEHVAGADQSYAQFLIHRGAR